MAQTCGRIVLKHARPTTAHVATALAGASVDSATGERVAFTCGPDAGRMAVERQVARTVASR
jgi:hypothetical protein